MSNPTLYPLVSTGCSLRISGCQHITSTVRLFFLRNKSIFFSLLPSAWNVIIRPGTHCYFIVWQLQNRIEILHICCPGSFCKILPLRACEAAFPLDLWPQRALTSLCSSPGALCLERRQWHSILQPSPQGAPGKKYLQDSGSSPQNWEVKIESRVGLGRVLDSRLFLGAKSWELQRAFVSLTVGRVTARWHRNPRAGEEILDRGKARAEFLFSTML